MEDNKTTLQENEKVDENSVQPTQDDRPVMIDVSHVNMEFVLSREKVDNLKEYVIRKLKRNLEVNKFKALDDVTFHDRFSQLKDYGYILAKDDIEKLSERQKNVFLSYN